jgi:hypothetical protein
MKPNGRLIMIENTIFMHIEDISISEAAILIRVINKEKYLEYIDRARSLYEEPSSFVVSELHRIPMNLNNIVALSKLNLGSVCQLHRRFEQVSLSDNYTYISNIVKVISDNYSATRPNDIIELESMYSHKRFSIEAHELTLFNHIAYSTSELDIVRATRCAIRTSSYLNADRYLMNRAMVYICAIYGVKANGDFYNCLATKEESGAWVSMSIDELINSN